MLTTLAAVSRSGYIESVHQGILCVTDPSGKIIYSRGDTKTHIFFRSSAKPLQVIPFIQSGGARSMNYTPEEIALACSSHSGHSEHQAVVRRILKRLDLTMTDLHCGTMSPYNEEENKRLIAQKEEPSPLHASCSGKHTAMLAYCKFRGWDIARYEALEHPLQQEILRIISEFTDEESETISIGTDGCGLPIFMLPVEKIALSYARLTQFAQHDQSVYHDSCRCIYEAMVEHPKMVAGPGEFCTELMEATHGKLIGKVGAEAVYCLGIKKGSLGVCIKIADGNERAVYPVVIQLLLELGVLTKEEHEKLKQWHKTELTNNLKEHIGDIIPVFHKGEPKALGDKI